MTTIIRAHYDGKAIIPDEAVDLPVNSPLMVQVEEVVEAANSMTGEQLARSGLVGLWKDRTDIGDSLEFARKLRKEAETRHHEVFNTHGAMAAGINEPRRTQKTRKARKTR